MQAIAGVGSMDTPPVKFSHLCLNDLDESISCADPEGHKI